MKKDFVENFDMKMWFRQRVMFRTFFINLILGLFVWALTAFVPLILYVAVWATGISPMMMYFSIVAGIAFWQMLNVVFFLIPAIAIWWERKYLK